MIKMYLVKPKNEDNLIKFPNEVYDTFFNEEWFLQPIVKRIILEVEKLKQRDILLNDEYGHPISPYSISTGSKTLILMAQDFTNESCFRLSNLGDNCYNILEDIAKTKDIFIYANCLPIKDIQIQIMESGKVVYTDQDFIEEKYKLMEEGVIPNEYTENKYI